MFELQTFPARDGDCLILTWGEPGAPHRMLIDGGREGTWPFVKAAILKLPEAQRVFELLVITHIDADHIAGVLKMLSDPDRPVAFKEIWFNAYHHLIPFVEHETFGGEQGEKLSNLLKAKPELWNARFGHGPVVAADPATPPRLEIAGLQLTLLSPTKDKLARLEPEWKPWITKEGLRPEDLAPAELEVATDIPPGYEAFGGSPDVEALAVEPLSPDKEPPNGSSIAFAAAYGEHRVLLTGDAHPEVLTAALRALPEAERRFNLVKLSHHGSRANISENLLETWRSDRFLVSTNGSHHHHPDRETIARLIKARLGAKTLYFNHRHEEAADWDRPQLMATHGYQAIYPTVPGELTLDITSLTVSA